MYKKLFIVSLIVFLVQAKDDKCKWADNHGNNFDLNPLRSQKNYQVPDTQTSMGMFNMLYEFNFCSVGVKCQDRVVAAFEALEVLGKVTENCDILGTLETQSIKLLNPTYPEMGISVTYSQGDKCFDVKDDDSLQNMMEEDEAMSMIPRSITYQIVCSQTSEENFHVIDSSQCNVILGINHNVGCKIGSLKSRDSQLYFIYFVFISMVYLGFGILYNQRMRGLQGVEALPNKEFWKSVPTLILFGVRYSIQQILQLISKYSGGGSGGQIGGKGYSTV